MSPDEATINVNVNLGKKLLPFPIAVAALALCGWCFCKRVQKPAQNGKGPVAFETDTRLDPPEYHNPADWWRLHHPLLLNAGDFELKECAECHKAETHCNRCHSYIGARLQTLPDVPMREPFAFQKEAKAKGQ